MDLDLLWCLILGKERVLAIGASVRKGLFGGDSGSFSVERKNWAARWRER